MEGAYGRWVIDDVRTIHYTCVDCAEMRILSVTPVCLCRYDRAHFFWEEIPFSEGVEMLLITLLKDESRKAVLL